MSNQDNPSTELETYIRLKYFPVRHTKEYLATLPDSILCIIINNIFTAQGQPPPVTPFPLLKLYFLNQYEVYIGFQKETYKAIVETVIETELLKYYEHRT